MHLRLPLKDIYDKFSKHEAIQKLIEKVYEEHTVVKEELAAIKRPPWKGM